MDHEHVDEPAMWPQILQAFKRSGEFIWRDDGIRRGAGDYRTPHIGKPAVEYIRFSQNQIMQAKQRHLELAGKRDQQPIAHQIPHGARFAAAAA